MEKMKYIFKYLTSGKNPSVEIDREWLEVAKRRLAELRSGSVKPIPGNEVFSKIRKRFEK
jgi:hypothetical protein